MVLGARGPPTGRHLGRRGAKDAPPLLEAAGIQFEVRLVPLLWGDVILPDLRLEQPKLALARDEKGVPNWSFSKNPATAAATEVVTPDERTEAPVIGQVDIKDGHFTYEDKSRDLMLEGDITTATGEAEKVQGIRFEAKGTLQGKKLLVRFAGGSIMSLRDEDKPYPLDLFAAYGATEVSVKGTVGDPFTMAAANLDLTLKGPDLSEIFPLLGVPAPPTPPYDLKGHLAHEDETWRFTDMQGRIGDSDMAGAITIEYGGKKPLLTADLVSKNLDFDDLAPLVGAPPDSDETASAEQKKTAAKLKQQDEIFPDVPLKVDLLDVMDMEVKLDAKKVTAENYLPIEALAGTVVIRGGKAVVKPLHMRVAGGSVDGALSLDSGPKPAVAAADLKMRDVDLKPFFRGTRVPRHHRRQDGGGYRHPRAGEIPGRRHGHGRRQDLLDHDRRIDERLADRGRRPRHRRGAPAVRHRGRARADPVRGGSHQPHQRRREVRSVDHGYDGFGAVFPRPDQSATANTEDGHLRRREGFQHPRHRCAGASAGQDPRSRDLDRKRRADPADRARRCGRYLLRPAAERKDSRPDRAAG